MPNITKTWDAPHKAEQKDKSEKKDLCLAKILPAKYKPVDIIKVVNKQTHAQNHDFHRH
jgi:hypothetical protein